MATYSINTTVRRETILGRVLDKLNAERALNAQPALSLTQLAQRLFNDTLEGYTKQQDDEDAAAIFIAYLAASNAVQASIKSQLGIA